MRIEPKRLGILLGIALAFASACGAEEDPLAGDDYTAAIPSAEMLALTADDAGEEVTEPVPGGTANGVAQLGRDVMAGLDELRRSTHDALAWLVTASTPTEITRGNTTCRVWEAPAEGVSWQLVSCLVDARRDRYGFVLRGRPVGSTDEAAWRVVFAGEGVRLPDFGGARRGAGRVGYNFDHLAELTGDDVGGQIGIGYRIAGRARQLVLGLRDVHGEGDSSATTALFRFNHVLGRGGRFAFLAGGDWLMRDENDALVEGQDGIDELARIAMAWNDEGAARTLAIVCGGSVGEGTCVYVAQCWTAAGEATHGAVQGDGPVWNETECPAVQVDPPEEEELGDAEDEAGAPIVDEPPPSPEE